jgi:hypothetical protein
MMGRHRRAFKHVGQGLAKHGFLLPDVAASDEHAPDGAEGAFDPMGKDLTAVAAVDLTISPIGRPTASAPATIAPVFN